MTGRRTSSRALRGGLGCDRHSDHVLQPPVEYRGGPDARAVRRTRPQDPCDVLKDTGGDVVKFTAILQNYADDIQAMNGYDTLSFYDRGREGVGMGRGERDPETVRRSARGHRAWGRPRGRTRCGQNLSRSASSSNRTTTRAPSKPASTSSAMAPARPTPSPLAPEHVEQFKRILAASAVELA